MGVVAHIPLEENVSVWHLIRVDQRDETGVLLPLIPSHLDAEHGTSIELNNMQTGGYPRLHTAGPHRFTR